MQYTGPCQIMTHVQKWTHVINSTGSILLDTRPKPDPESWAFGFLWNWVLGRMIVCNRFISLSNEMLIWLFIIKERKVCDLRQDRTECFLIKLISYYICIYCNKGALILVFSCLLDDGPLLFGHDLF